MARKTPCTVVKLGPDRHARAVGREGHRVSGLVALRLAVDVGAQLRPSAGSVLVHAHVARKTPCTVVKLGPDRHTRTVGREGHRVTGLVALSLAVDVGAQLRPSARSVLVHAHVARITPRSAFVCPRSDCHARAVGREGQRVAEIVANSLASHGAAQRRPAAGAGRVLVHTHKATRPIR